MARRGKARVPTASELRRLITIARSTANGSRDSAIVAVSYRLGFRAKEIASLVIRDVLDDSGQIREDCQLSAANTKGGKPRVAYVTNPVVRLALKGYLDERRKQEGGLFMPTAPLFRSRKGGAFTPNTMQQLLHRLHEQAGIVGGRSHSGRRWFCTELLSKGVDIKAVSVLAGHANVSMTAQYAEDNPQRLRRIAAELG